MRKRGEKKQKVTKGMPSAVLLSIVIHAALFLLAGMLVVFTVVKKEEKRFEPPKAVERPKMKLKKPKVRVKKTSKPKPTQRIVTKMNRASMPDIQLPEMSDMGEGLEGGLTGFDMMPDLGEPTLFGASQSIGNDFVGTFYDFKRDRSGRNIPYSIEKYSQDLKEFVRNGWQPSRLSRYYRSPNNLYATTFMIPPVLSLIAPEAFGEPDTTDGWLWAIHYTGELVHKDAITFRFWGFGDDVMVVGVDNKVVLNACWPGRDQIIAPQWRTSSPDSYKYWLGNNLSVVGDWITLEPGVPLKMDVLIGEVPGGVFCSQLLVEVKGVEYENNRQNGPLLPIFTTAAPTLDLIETIHADLVPGEASITNGPVFCDYDTSGKVARWEPEKADPPVFAGSIKEEMRAWIGEGGKTLEAKFVAVIGGKTVLTDQDGRQRKVPLALLSDKDRLYVELAQPPKFNIDFSKQSSQRLFEDSPLIRWAPPKHIDYVFSAKLKQTSAGEYNHELKVEFFAIGEEIDGDNYILLDQQESRFTPTKENGRSHGFSGNTVPMRESTVYIHRRGQKYGGYLVVVTDERGRIIDHGTSHKWLLDILGELRTLPLGKHFDKTGARVLPPCPKSTFY
ncbi:MAG: hypothetical protein ABFR33_07275 [Verrucomicrobiota bacterium]